MTKLATAEEVADLLRVPVTTLYAWRAKRTGPPAVKVGRYLRYRLSDLEKWTNEQTD
jgi:excisionase family DNA binding protein